MKMEAMAAIEPLTYKAAVRQFYEQVFDAVSMPTKPTQRNGVAWPTACRYRYNSVVINPYCGRPTGKGENCPIPRISLNIFSTRLSRAQMRRWGVRSERTWRGYPYETMSEHRLELTTLVPELSDFAEWVLAWLTAKEAKDETLLPEPPSKLVRCGPPDKPSSNLHGYLWTQDAHDKYEDRLYRGAV
jgi:hypothetical protein